MAKEKTQEWSIPSNSGRPWELSTGPSKKIMNKSWLCPPCLRILVDLMEAISILGNRVAHTSGLLTCARHPRLTVITHHNQTTTTVNHIDLSSVVSPGIGAFTDAGFLLPIRSENPGRRRAPLVPPHGPTYPAISAGSDGDRLGPWPYPCHHRLQ